MIPAFLEDGNLPFDGHPHKATWKEVKERFCNGEHRSRLAQRLHQLIKRAKNCRFSKVVIMGSFVTSRSDPKDFDLMWLTGEAFHRDGLSGDCKELLESDRSRDRFGCDLFDCPENSEMLGYLLGHEYGFGIDKITKTPRGLVILDLETDDLS